MRGHAELRRGFGGSRQVKRSPRDQRGTKLRQRASRETGEYHSAVEAKGTVGAVFAVVQEGALVEEPDGLRPAAAAGAGLVDYLDVGQVKDEPAGLARAAAEVRVLEVHEEAFVEGADLPQAVPADDHARARDPVDRCRSGLVRHSGKLTLYERALREEAGQEGSA